MGAVLGIVGLLMIIGGGWWTSYFFWSIYGILRTGDAAGGLAATMGMSFILPGVIVFIAGWVLMGMGYGLGELARTRRAAEETAAYLDTRAQMQDRGR